jgi:hemerythrin
MTQALKLVEDYIQKEVDIINIQMKMLGKRRDELKQQFDELTTQIMGLDSQHKEYAEILNKLKLKQ